jgi:hypothetical protein
MNGNSAIIFFVIILMVQFKINAQELENSAVLPESNTELNNILKDSTVMIHMLARRNCMRGQIRMGDKCITPKLKCIFNSRCSDSKKLTTLFGFQGTRPNLKRKFFHSKILITKNSQEIFF